MKVFSLIIFVVLSLLISEAISQNLIAVQNGGNPTFYQQIDSAIVHSQDGDTIFIPGGTWSLTKPINKRLHLIGVGHNPDSSSATFPTKLVGQIMNLTAGASHGSITGINLYLGLTTGLDAVHFYTVSRCFISNNIHTNQLCDNFSFKENVINANFSYPDGGGASNCSFFNNIFCGIFYYNSYSYPIVNSVYKNNVFLYQSIYYYPQRSIAGQYLLCENNIFYGSTADLSQVYNSTFKNNLFTENISFSSSTNVGSNNILSQSQSSIFINCPSTGFSYSYDYHLQPTCPGKNAGTDGTDLGIYGGLYPWKPGSVPFNPHFQTVNISPVTNTSGNLPVNIKVAAQDH